MQILKVIGLLMEYPDELLWECKDDALALIRRDAPMLTDFALDLLNAPPTESAEVIGQLRSGLGLILRGL